MKTFRVIADGKIIGEGAVFTNGTVAWSMTTPNMQYPHLDVCQSMQDFAERHPRWDVSYK